MFAVCKALRVPCKAWLQEGPLRLSPAHSYSQEHSNEHTSSENTVLALSADKPAK